MTILMYNDFVNKITRFCGVAFILICLLTVGSRPPAEAQRGQTWQYFPDTGHSISGEFWAFYQSIPNAALIFGSPITEQFIDAALGREVQYFQRARFEYHPENPAGQRVVLTDLGPTVYEHTPSHGSVNGPNPLGCRFYAETGVSLCYAFLEFFDRNGGEAVFGRPISPYLFYNDRIVQYFQRARFDWYPEYAEGQKVVLAQMGRIYFDLQREDSTRLQPVKAENTPGEVMQIRTHAFTWKALTRPGDDQAVYVVVQDQTLEPVAGATAVITISSAQGGQNTISQTSDVNGVVILPLTVDAQAPSGVILIQAEVIYQGLESRSTTSFRIWH